MGKFIMRKVPTGIMFDLTGAEDVVLLTSEVYKSKASCKAGIASIVKNAVGEIEDQTVEEPVRQRHPKYELYKDKKDEFRFRLKATNGQVIGSSKGFEKKEDCEKAIASVKENVKKAQIVEPEKTEEKKPEKKEEKK